MGVEGFEHALDRTIEKRIVLDRIDIVLFYKLKNLLEELEILVAVIAIQHGRIRCMGIGDHQAK
jgi:hypothetical protein